MALGILGFHVCNMQLTVQTQTWGCFVSTGVKSKQSHPVTVTVVCCGNSQSNLGILVVAINAIMLPIKPLATATWEHRSQSAAKAMPDPSASLGNLVFQELRLVHS